MGEFVEVDHSGAGGKLLLNRPERGERSGAQILGYAVLDHHGGLPDVNGCSAGTRDRIEWNCDNIAPEISSVAGTGPGPVQKALLQKVSKPTPGFDLSAARRVAFSGLVDATSCEREALLHLLDGRPTDRVVSALADMLHDLRAEFDAHICEFDVDTERHCGWLPW